MPAWNTGVQEMASRGLAAVYDMADAETRQALLDSLTATLSGGCCFGAPLPWLPLLPALLALAATAAGAPCPGCLCCRQSRREAPAVLLGSEAAVNPVQPYPYCICFTTCSLPMRHPVQAHPRSGGQSS